MPRISLTRRQVAVTFDALARLSAYTDDEMRDVLGWNDDDQEAWSQAMVKVAHVNVEAECDAR